MPLDNYRSLLVSNDIIRRHHQRIRIRRRIINGSHRYIITNNANTFSSLITQLPPQNPQVMNNPFENQLFNGISNF
ncbi:hypothetical protein RCL_jg211.t1 [Rhizophagus clarus]|uniref:Uncharacterized protein n=1 Tax=Rhizophagus clarus TaxID=94130 RepID=A0A8H3QY64_9GLOM|nr:hypothetical protein RCL_jg211.t1 [Rhizophagus clarus]